jgi:hypothetical protein
MSFLSPPKTEQKNDYRAFFFNASGLFFETLYRNSEKLRNLKERLNVNVCKRNDLETELSTYFRTIHPHVGPEDKRDLCKIVRSWQNSHVITDEEKHLCLRILNTMHKNHSEFLEISANLFNTSKKRRDQQTNQEQNRNKRARKQVIWCGAIMPSSRMVEEWMGIDSDPMLHDDFSDLDLSGMVAQKDWDWTAEIDSFFSEVA